MATSSYDKVLKKFKLRQFHVESFVNEYIIKNISEKNIDFETESIENIPKVFVLRNLMKLSIPEHLPKLFPLPNLEKISKLTLKSHCER